ncbi:hypothetical protein [Paenibacillus sp. JJ-100]|nr:hypothetical protein [Paenibacillus sp. JJ-100]
MNCRLILTQSAERLSNEGIRVSKFSYGKSMELAGFTACKYPY